METRIEEQPRLPKEIWEMILSYIPRHRVARLNVILTCKAWKESCRSLLSWYISSLRNHSCATRKRKRQMEERTDLIRKRLNTVRHVWMGHRLSFDPVGNGSIEIVERLMFWELTVVDSMGRIYSYSCDRKGKKRHTYKDANIMFLGDRVRFYDWREWNNEIGFIICGHRCATTGCMDVHERCGHGHHLDEECEHGYQHFDMKEYVVGGYSVEIPMMSVDEDEPDYEDSMLINSELSEIHRICSSVSISE